MKTHTRTSLRCILLAAALFAVHSASAFYDSNTGRWFTRDPHGEPGGEALRFNNSTEEFNSYAELLPEGPNLYAFVGNRPVDRIDIDGRRWLDWLWDDGDPKPPKIKLPPGGGGWPNPPQPIFTYKFYRNDSACTRIHWWVCFGVPPAEPPDTVAIHPKDQAGFSKCMGLARELWNNAGQQPWSPPNEVQLRRACNYAKKCYDRYW